MQQDYSEALNVRPVLGESEERTASVANTHAVELRVRTVLLGDAFELFDSMPAASIDLVITSPPYWGHREYGLNHNWDLFNDIPKVRRLVETQGYDWYRTKGGVLGLEPYPEWYVSHLAETLSKANRCLKPAGSMWINIGDTYFARWSSIRDSGRQGLNDDTRVRRKTPMGSFRQEKQLLLLPSRFAIEMQRRGWILRNDVIWYKPNATPRPEGDRLKLAHEHFFHFVKKPKEGRPEYYYDPAYAESRHNDVVTVNVSPGENGHSATFPRTLITPRILTSCPPGGIVLDPFCGTGRALEVAWDLGRLPIGFELQPKFQSVAQRKMADMAKKGERASTLTKKDVLKGNIVSEWFGQRIYPLVRADLTALSGKNFGSCPFLSSVLSEKTPCVKNENSLGVCTISSASNGPRQDWLVCPYRVINSDIVRKSCYAIFKMKDPATQPLPVSVLKSAERLNAFKLSVQDRGYGYVFFQDKLGGEISVLSTDKSPEMAFDVTLVEVVFEKGAYLVKRYGILEVQTMDFHGSYKHAVANLRDGLRLHPDDFPEVLQNKQELWAGEKVEGPNIANVFKRTFYQIMVKFQLSGRGAAAGTVLALPRAVWDSWQPFLGKPQVAQLSDGSHTLVIDRTEAQTELNSHICVFDLDGNHKGAVSPVNIEMFIRVQPDQLSHHAFSVVPAEMLKSMAESDSILARIRSRLSEWWPEIEPA